MNSLKKISASIHSILSERRTYIKFVYPFLLGTLNISTGHAVEYNSRVDTAVTTLQSGDVVNVTGDKENAGAIYVRNNPIDVGDNGFLKVLYDSSLENVRGVNIAAGLVNNFGKNSSIHVNSTDTTGSSAIAINIGGNTTFKADALDVQVSSSSAAIGIELNDHNSTLSLGSGSSIITNAITGVAGLYSKGSNDNIVADHLTIVAKATAGDANANAVSIKGDDTRINFGSGSSILAEGYQGNGILISGSNNSNIQFSAESLLASGKGENVYGINVNKASEESLISLGSDSQITTDGESGSGILFGAGSLATLVAKNLTIQTEGKASSAIEAKNGYISIESGKLTSNQGRGVIAENTKNMGKQSPLIELSNTEIHSGLTAAEARGKSAEIRLNGSTVISDNAYGLLSASGGTISADSVNISSFSGIGAQSGGKIDFTGQSVLSGGNGTALSSTGSESVINGTGTASIQGNIVAGDQGEVNLDLGNGSVITGSAINNDSGYISIKLADDSKWVTPQNSAVNHLSLDNSTLVISPSQASNTVTVQGDYTANNGHVLFDTALAGDNSATDKLVISGNTSGNTSVSVYNAGGSGAKTLNGIELIRIGGV